MNLPGPVPGGRDIGKHTEIYLVNCGMSRLNSGKKWPIVAYSTLCQFLLATGRGLRYGCHVVVVVGVLTPRHAFFRCESLGGTVGKIEMVLLVNPAGQMRARSKPGQPYKHPKQKSREAVLAALLYPYRPAKPLRGPILLSVVAYLQAPQNPPKPANRMGMSPAQWRYVVAEDLLYRPRKPDLDNIVKHLKDVMTQMKFWADDNQVCEIRAQKFDSRNPRWVVTVEELPAIRGEAA